MPKKLHPIPIDQAVIAGDLKQLRDEIPYAGVHSFFRRQYRKSAKGADLAFLGVPYDAAVSNRPGARFGPSAVRAASAVSCQDPAFPFDFNPFAKLGTVDCGDVALDYGHHEETPARIEAAAKEILDEGAVLMAVGGDHFVTYPLLRAHVERYGPLALIQFDAHQDTWPDDEGRIDHGSFVGRAVREGLIDAEHSVQIGIRTVAPETCGIEIISADQCYEWGMDKIAERIKTRVGPRAAYLTFDIDCLDPAYAPGTGTPVPGGLSSREALALVRMIRALDIKGYDVVEVLPAHDHGEITSLAAAAILQTFAACQASKPGAKS